MRSTETLSAVAAEPGDRTIRATVVVNVRADPRYLTTFGSTLSEIVAPVRHSETG